MEMKIVIAKPMGDKPEDMPMKEKESFPIDSKWKEEATKHLKMAYDICSEGDGEDAMDACEMIQQIMDHLKEDTDQESEDMISGMQKAKDRSTNYMDNFQDSESDTTK